MEKEHRIELLNAQDVRRLLKCSLPWVYKAADQGLLPCVRIPCPGAGDRVKTLVRFKLNDVLNFIEDNYQART